ncbi:hypothetical protein ACGFIK_21795 [Micromonospora sp. NPDC048871]|uniref:hypothetical protein n=1 Tax=Micromonospora sp. NPDC048871 TaxID=3364259 RepID=UPI003721A7D6
MHHLDGAVLRIRLYGGSDVEQSTAVAEVVTSGCSSETCDPIRRTRGRRLLGASTSRR